MGRFCLAATSWLCCKCEKLIMCDLEVQRSLAEKEKAGSDRENRLGQSCYVFTNALLETL